MKGDGGSRKVQMDIREVSDREERSGGGWGDERELRGEEKQWEMMGRDNEKRGMGEWRSWGEELREMKGFGRT